MWNFFHMLCKLTLHYIFKQWCEIRIFGWKSAELNFYGFVFIKLSELIIISQLQYDFSSVTTSTFWCIWRLHCSWSFWQISILTSKKKKREEEEVCIHQADDKTGCTHQSCIMGCVSEQPQTQHSECLPFNFFFFFLSLECQIVLVQFWWIKCYRHTKAWKKSEKKSHI